MLLKRKATLGGICLGLFFFTLVVYYLTSAGNTPYNYFTRLAASFLQGKYWLLDNPPWLSELIPAGPQRFYAVYPPLPALLAMPFVLWFGKEFPQQYLAHLLGAGSAILTMALAYTIKRDKKLALYAFLLSAFGSILWYLSATGSVWYLGQVTACFFLLAALLESLNKKRMILVGALLGAAYLARVNLLVTFPVFLLFNWQKVRARPQSIVSFALGLAPFLLFNAFYNFLRFGVLWDKGYFLLPEILHETQAPWFYKGVVSIHYLPENLRVAFWSFPKILGRFPYLQPSWAGLAMWITTPAFIFALRAKLKEATTWFSWLGILLVFAVVGIHGGAGFAQFGYRFAVDFYPFLFFLTLKGIARDNGPRWFHWLLLLLAIVVNFWGVLWINKFGWVSF